ncbi:MAG: DUF1905 domain-containing protein [Saprospiraceae bacterium]|nr:DUF1905 domain-containing protein [Saprospiraceae bacterium]
MKIQFSFSAKVWQYSGKGRWYFVTLPTNLSATIRKEFKSEEKGWGRLTCTVTIESSEWKSSIWYDSKKSAYLLPIRSEIRLKENIQIDQLLKVKILI